MIDEADRLYELPLDEFVAERDALAKALREQGRRDDANAVKALRKPTVVVAAVNQRMRAHARAARKLLDAADRAAAQPGDRRALSAHGAALDELTAGEPDPRVRAVMHAASLDRDLREEFAAGRLSAEPAPAGFGALTGMPAPAPARKAAPAAKGPSARELAAARRRVDRAERRVEAARAELADAERELAQARAQGA